MGACGAEGGDDDSFVVAQVSPALDAGTPASSDAGAPPPAYTATVSATGSGCPEGSYVPRIDAQGGIEVSFEAFEVSVGPGVAESIKDCQIVVKLSAQAGASYQVSSYAHNGHAMVLPGVEGKQSSSFYFLNARGGGRLRNSIVIGPRNGPVLSEPLSDTAADKMWTPCALENQLHITTRLTLQNGGKDTSGILTFGTTDEPHVGVALDLNVRPCTIPPPPPPR